MVLGSSCLAPQALAAEVTASFGKRLEALGGCRCCSRTCPSFARVCPTRAGTLLSCLSA